MTSHIHRHVGAAVLLLLLSGPLAAVPLELRLDPQQTQISFLLPTNTHEVHGLFALDTGVVSFDPETGAASGEIRVRATGAETGNAKRDRKMHQKVLESERYPLFIFRAESVKVPSWHASGRNHVELVGRLDIHGAEHPATWITDVDIQGDQVEGTATLDVPFVDWGMADPSFLVFRVEKIVHVEVDLAGTLAAAEAADDD